MTDDADNVPASRPAGPRIAHGLLAGLVLALAIDVSRRWLVRPAPAPSSVPGQISASAGPAPEPIIIEPGVISADLPATRPAYLDAVIPAFELQDVPLHQALDALVDQSGTHVCLVHDLPSPRGFFAQEEYNPLLTLRLRNATLQTALEAVLASARASVKQELAYRADPDALRIGRPEWLADPITSRGAVRVYDVRDLMRGSVALSQSLRSAAPANLDNARRQSEPERSAGLFGGGGTRPRSYHRPASPEELLSVHLIDLVQAIDPPSWRALGDAHYFSGRLVIRQTNDNHDRIARLLNALRRDGLPHSGQPFSGQ